MNEPLSFVRLGMTAMRTRALATELFKLKDDMEHASDMLAGLEGLVTYLEEIADEQSHSHAV
jgi:hypothetical protein